MSDLFLNIILFFFLFWGGVMAKRGGRSVCVCVREREREGKKKARDNLNISHGKKNFGRIYIGFFFFLFPLFSQKKNKKIIIRLERVVCVM